MNFRGKPCGDCRRKLGKMLEEKVGYPKSVTKQEGRELAIKLGLGASRQLLDNLFFRGVMNRRSTFIRVMELLGDPDLYNLHRSEPKSHDECPYGGKRMNESWTNEECRKAITMIDNFFRKES